MSKVEVGFSGINLQWSELLIAELSQIGFDSFWQEENVLRAYINHDDFIHKAIYEISNKYKALTNLNFKIQLISPEQWDVAEKDKFRPFVVANKIAIRRDTDSFTQKYQFELIINPAMAFGSGNHPSTSLCLEMMLGLNFEHKSVADIGTGTGILAVMSEKLGAKKVYAFDNNPWAIQVAFGTLHLNASEKVKLELKGIEEEFTDNRQFDIVLANLNFSVFETEFKKIAKAVNFANGILLVSGVMMKDEKKIIDKYRTIGFFTKNKLSKDGWVAIVFQRN